MRSILKRPSRKINKADLYPPAHNGLVAGRSPAGAHQGNQEPISVLFGITAPETPRFVYVCHALATARLTLHFATGLGPSHFNHKFGGIIVRNSRTGSHPFSPTSR